MSSEKFNFLDDSDHPAAKLFYRVQKTLEATAWRLVYDSRASLDLRKKAKQVTANVAGWAKIVTSAIISQGGVKVISDGDLERMVREKLESMRGPRTPADDSEEKTAVVGRRK